jgi:hypothetical protein
MATLRPISAMRKAAVRPARPLPITTASKKRTLASAIIHQSPPVAGFFSL